MNSPLVSIIMPAYNAERFINESIDSVLNQTYLNWELIVIDDESTDTTAALVETKIALDNRIKYFWKRNAGAGIARNFGIARSRGSLIAFLDADDLWLDSKLAISVAELASENIDLIFSDSFIFRNELVEPLTEKMGVISGYYAGKEGILSFLIQNRIPILTAVLKKEAFLKTPGFTSVQITADYDLWLQLLDAGCSFKAIDQPLSAYRIHDESLTKDDRRVLYDTILVIKEFLYAHPEYTESVDRSLLQKIKYWLYDSTDASTSRLRILIDRLRPTNRYILPYLLSYFLPFKLIRKLINNTILKNVY